MSDNGGKLANSAAVIAIARLSMVAFLPVALAGLTAAGFAMSRLVTALDANTNAVVQIDKRLGAAELGVVTANDRINALGQWTRRNADDIDDLKKRIYPLTRNPVQ